MSWSDTLQLQAAAYRGQRFEIESITDTINYAYAAHSYPYRAGAAIEDTGRDPRKIHLVAVFYGARYERRLKDFLALLDVPGSATLDHPIFGPINAKVVSVGVPHDADQPDYCALPVDFIEDAVGGGLFSAVSDQIYVDACYRYVNEVHTASIAPFVKQLGWWARFNKGFKAALNAMNDAMAAAQKYIKDLGAPLFETLDLVATGLDYLTVPERFVADLRAGFDARLAAIHGRANIVQHSQLARLLGYTPDTDRVSNTSVGGASGVKQTSTPAAPTAYRVVVAQITSPILPAQYTDHDGITRSQPTVITTQIALAQTLALANAAIDLLATQISTPEMTPPEIQAIADSSRSAISQSAAQWRVQYPDIEDHRPVIEGLKALAVSIDRLAQQVINQKPPLIQRVAPAACNLRLLAFWWYQDAARADEVLRLNPTLSTPNFIRAGQSVWGYAK